MKKNKKILLLAPIHEEKDYIKQNSDLEFPSYQVHQAWLDAFKELEREVKVFKYSNTYIIPNTIRIYVVDFLKSKFPLFTVKFLRRLRRYNLLFIDDYFKDRAFSKLVNKYKPELLIISGGLYGIKEKTLIDEKNKHKFACILMSGVNPVYGASKTEKKLLKNNYFDIIFVNDAGHARNWKKMGANKVIVLPISAYNPKIHKKYSLSAKEKQSYVSDICFVGSLTDNRQRILSKLINYKLKIWGNFPPGVELCRELIPYYKGNAMGVKMAKIYNSSKIALNIHEDMKYGGNLRTFEIPACGTLQIIDNFNSKWYINNKEIVQFKNVKDLKFKIDHYLKNTDERKSIAHKGYVKTINNHSFVDRFRLLFSQLEN